MNEFPLQGNLSALPFSQLLFCIWQQEKTGLLRIKKEKKVKRLYFKNGNIVGELESLSEKDFLKLLTKKKILNAAQLKKCRTFSRENKITVIKSLTELNILSPSRLWELMEAYFKNDAFSLFDLPKAKYLFEAEDISYEPQILRHSQTLNLILQGIRRMKNQELIESHIPDEDETIEILFPVYLDQIDFEPHEKYLLKLIENTTSLKNIHKFSAIGKGETQRLIFTLISLGIISIPHKKECTTSAHEFLPEELDRIMEAFNSQCSYIYKYISKEIGPAARSVLSKCLDDLKPNLSPPFQALELRPDGSIEMKPSVKTHINASSNERWKNFLKSLDEILAAEVLAVKKTLGTAHETALIENLEKTGDLF